MYKDMGSASGKSVAVNAETEDEPRTPFLIGEDGKGVRFQTFQAHEVFVENCCFSPDSSSLVTCSGDMSVRCWDVKDETLKITTSLVHPSTVWSCDFSPDGKLLCTCCSDGCVFVWDMEKKSVKHNFVGHNGVLFCCKFGPDGDYLAAGGLEKTVKLWTLSTETCRILHGHRNFVEDVAFCPHGNILASASKDTTIRLWRLDDIKQKPKVLRGHSKWVTSCNFSKSGNCLASTAMDGTVRLWEIHQLKTLRILKGHTCIVWDCTFMSINNIDDVLVSCASDRTVRFWNVDIGKEFLCEKDLGAIFRHDSHGAQLLCCAGCSDSKYLSVCDYEGRMYFGKVKTILKELLAKDNELRVDLANYWKDK